LLAAEKLPRINWLSVIALRLRLGGHRLPHSRSISSTTVRGSKAAREREELLPAGRAAETPPRHSSAAAGQRV
jgi:hypothetical protein